LAKITTMRFNFIKLLDRTSLYLLSGGDGT